MNDDIEPEDTADADHDELEEMDQVAMIANANEIIVNTINLDSIDQCDIDIVLPKHMRCFVHMLNLLPKDFDTAINNSIPGSILNSALGKLKRLWFYSRKSVRAKAIVKEICGKMLIIYVVTRWNSKYHAIKRVMELNTKV